VGERFSKTIFIFSSQIRHHWSLKNKKRKIYVFLPLLEHVKKSSATRNFQVLIEKDFYDGGGEKILKKVKKNYHKIDVTVH
jgi:hypothetical protein